MKSITSLRGNTRAQPRRTTWRWLAAYASQHKGTDLASIDPASGALTPLFNPRRDRWREHFELHEALLIGRTAVGRVTVRLLQLNLPARVTERELLLRSGTLRIPE